SRGAWVAFAVTLAVLLLGWAHTSARRVLAIITCMLPLAGLALGLAGFACPGERHLLDTVTERIRLIGESASRRHIWRAGFDLFRAHPLRGWGLDTFQLAFGHARPAAYWQTEWNVT